MYNPRFEKDVFKRDVRNNVKTLFRKEVEEATPQQLFQAVADAVKEAIIDDWLATQKQYEKDDPKTVYYMSMEFLLGRALGNNLINMTAYKEVKEALEEMGIDLNVIEDQEPDPALGSHNDRARILHNWQKVQLYNHNSRITGRIALLILSIHFRTLHSP